MSIRALVTVLGSTAALALPAAAAAAPSAHGSAAQAPSPGHHGGLKPKAAAKPKAARTPARPLLVFVQPFFVPSTDMGIGATDSCASYTGCTDEEYCIVWGVRCELVPLPVGTLDPRRPAAP